MSCCFGNESKSFEAEAEKAGLADALESKAKALKLERKSSTSCCFEIVERIQ